MVVMHLRHQQVLQEKAACLLFKLAQWLHQVGEGESAFQVLITLKGHQTQDHLFTHQVMVLTDLLFHGFPEISKWHPSHPYPQVYSPLPLNTPLKDTAQPTQTTNASRNKPIRNVH